MARSSVYFGSGKIDSVASIEFLSWLVITTGIYWISPQAVRRYLLILSTAVILIANDPGSLLILAMMTATVLVATQFKGERQLSVLIGGIAAIVLALLAFKFLAAGVATTSAVDRFVPLGMSYYSLRCVHMLMERYLERIPRPAPSEVIEYLFFPATIVAGPINRFPEFVAAKLSEFQFARFSAGLERILYGYVKIVVLSNYILSYKLFRWVESEVELGTALSQYLASLDYGLTLYFQFSGYSDIAIGFALLLGHRVIENFSWPFLKSNIVMFWRSWHISLTRLCREYVFTSVHASTRQAWLGVIATMLAISLWHGLTLNYLAWGLYHATGLLVYRLWSGSTTAVSLRRALPSYISQFFGWFLTFQFVILGFIWTKEDSLAASFAAWAQIFGGFPGNV